QGQPDGADAVRHVDVAPSRRDGCGRRARACDRRRDPRGEERDVRHEAFAQRSDGRRDERGRRCDRREARRGSARMSQRPKVTVVGAGNVGATCAQVLATRDYADVVLVDIKEGLPEGKALDVNQMGAVLGYEPNVVGSTSYEQTAGSDVVVATAGLPRSPGMSRDDPATPNEKIGGSATDKVVRQ